MGEKTKELVSYVQVNLQPVLDKASEIIHATAENAKEKAEEVRSIVLFCFPCLCWVGIDPPPLDPTLSCLLGKGDGRGKSGGCKLCFCEDALNR